MATSWYQGYAKCPYYLDDDRSLRIICQGAVEGTKNIWKFPTREDRKLQLDVFCCDKFQNCEIYRMLKGIYEED